MNSTQPMPLPVYDHRPGAGPTLVFLHYWGGSARTWDLVVDRLPGRDVLTVDFRGWSRSSGLPGPYTLGQFADDTLSVLGDAGVTDHVLVGHSMGGKVAQLVAATRPAGLRGIVLVGSGPAKPSAQITPEYQEALSHAYDSDESVAGARDHILTATRLPATIKARVAVDSRAGTDAGRTSGRCTASRRTSPSTPAWSAFPPSSSPGRTIRSSPPTCSAPTFCPTCPRQSSRSFCPPVT
ncbi:alpha/beta hydrolase [Streptomyces sp. NPDC058420]|uniref:alpha/beta hydrolase n=1 Tax=Streptomyces sp. NPDC058420 TaxID=3346489 RepID=UPI00364EB2DF